MIKVKEGVDFTDLQKVKPELFFILSKINIYCRNLDLPLTITSIFSDRENVKSKSTTHEDFRAIDIRTRDWEEKQVLDLEDWLNGTYNSYGAISSSTHKTRLAYYHNEHLHIQVKR